MLKAFKRITGFTDFQTRLILVYNRSTQAKTNNRVKVKTGEEYEKTQADLGGGAVWAKYTGIKSIVSAGN